MSTHAVVGFTNHVFVNLYLDVLVNQCGIEPDKLTFITLDSKNEAPLVESVNAVHYEKLSVSDLDSFETITFISLNANNAFYIEQLFSYSNKLREKVYVYLTDDELDRWRIVKDKHGKICEDKKLSISESCVKVIPKVKNFISLESAFREALEDVLDRDDFRIIDARDPFGTMPTNYLKHLEQIYRLGSHHDSPEKSVLIGSKQGVFSVGQVIGIIKAFKKAGMLSECKFHIFTNKNNKKFRILIDLYCLYLRKINRIAVDIGFPIATNSLTYTSLVMSCSCLLLQGRGGISTARTYLRFGRGRVAVQANTPNERELVNGLGLEVLNYQDFDQLADKIKSQQIDVEENTLRMKQDLKRSLASLTALYR